LSRLFGALFFTFLIFLIPRLAHSVEVERAKTKGIEAWLVEDHSNPIIAVRIAFRGGAALDPPGKGGLARMAAALLDEGAGELDAEKFQLRLDELAITLEFSANLDTVSANMQTLTENRDAAFDLLRLALTSPRFDAEPVARIRSQLQAAVRHASSDPNTVARLRFFKEVFPDQPYGRPVEGTRESLSAISVTDLRHFAATQLAKDNMVIGVAGDISPPELERLLSSTFRDLPAKASTEIIAAAEPVFEGGVTVVEKPSKQSAIVFGQQGVRRDDSRFYAASIMNRVLGGGGLTSRLYEEVREKRGLAYGVSTSLLPLEHAALILGGAGTVNDKAGETVSIVRQQWKQMADSGITEKELADAKTYLTGSFPLRFTSSGSIASILVAIQLRKLGFDYLDRRNALIESVTLEEVNTLARELLNPSVLSFVVVGQPEGLNRSN
jgi:zinc protease